MKGSSGTEAGPPPRNGYPSLAAWIAHDPDGESYVFRRFDRLSARNLLNMQSKLIELEKRLDDWDDMAESNRNTHLPLSLRRWETFEELERDARRPEHTRAIDRAKLEAQLKEGIREYRRSHSACTVLSSCLMLKQMKRYFSKRRYAISTAQALEYSPLSVHFWRILCLFSVARRNTCLTMRKILQLFAHRRTRIFSLVYCATIGHSGAQRIQILETIHNTFSNHESSGSFLSSLR